MRRLLDTDILIDHLRGKPEALDFLTSVVRSGDRLLCSVVTRAELLAGMRPSEESAARALLGLFEGVSVDEAVAEAAGEYRRRYGRSHGVLLPDALIAATARVHGATLCTTNLKHYPMGDFPSERPY